MTAPVGQRGTLLVVDDEPDVREVLAEYFTAHGYAVIGAENAEAAKAVATRESVDLALVDIHMPGEDGLSLARHLRERYAGMAIIMLTSASTVVDRIVGLEIGADDYVVKPFEPRELVARIRSVLRRASRNAPPAAENEALAFEGWQLDPLKRRLIDPEGAIVAISSVEFRLLMAFLEHPRQVLNRDRLLDMVQGREAHLFDRAVDNQVSRLRRKIEIDSRNPQIIQTVWGGGYMLAADVRRVQLET